MTKVFNEDSVVVFLKKMSLLMDELAAQPPPADYPTENYFHALKGNAGENMSFVAAVFLTTENQTADDLMNNLLGFSRIYINKKPIQNFTPKTYKETEDET